jgi:hypothetical protein
MPRAGAEIKWNVSQGSRIALALHPAYALGDAYVVQGNRDQRLTEI